MMFRKMFLGFLIAAVPTLAQAQNISCNLEGSVGAGVASTGFADLGTKLDLGSSGGLIGLGGGCDLRNDGWVVGLLGRYSFLDVSGTIFGAKINHDNLWEGAIRLGRDIGPVTPYVLAGWSITDVKAKEIDFTKQANGLLLGGGIDLAINANLLLRAEYAWHAFETFRIDTTKIDSDLHVARLALVFRLGGDLLK